MSNATLQQRLAAGKSLRERCTRGSHADWSPATRDPIDILERSNQGRLAELVPLRYARMLTSPFAFLRGAAAVMAYDLAGTPVTGLSVQACGDCHLANFGLFATPERNLIFDINDFDETLPGPWEWDLKRLAASFVLAGRENGFSARQNDAAVAVMARSYRQHLRELMEMSPLEVWYARVTADDLVASAPSDEGRELRAQMAAKARRRIGAKLFPRLVREVAGQYRFVENPPVMTRVDDAESQALVEAGLADYRASLPADRRYLFDRYRLADFALRVVGVGSVGTRCYVALLVCDDATPLLLQVKEARPSVLEPYTAPSNYANQGERVVVGQRLMQAASDVFLGWLRAGTGHDYYVRQLRDMKFSIPVEDLPADSLQRYADVCGWTLARAHAKSGDAAGISGYLGQGDKFDQALVQFAAAYATQTEQDHAQLTAAAATHRIPVAANP